uniref:IQ domain-containing protein N n=1 Tax=Neovison vison TaxID=452646 RepID=A0A8C7BHS1_NEOVI
MPPLQTELTRPETKTMQEAAQLPLSTDAQNVYQPQSVSSLQDKAGTLSPQPQHEPVESRETLLQQHDKDVTVPRHIPRLRAVVESQAFKNVLVDEMDMMLSRAATLIQANWRGYQLRQKLISQMKAAKAIQEAWRRFNTRRLLRSGKTVEKKVSVDEGDIPYHAPQQVRFQPPGEVKPPVAQPVMVSKETQFPSSDSLDTCTHQLALLQAQGGPQPGMQVPGSTGGPSVTFLPHQTIAIRLPCPVNLDAKCHPCLMTRTVRNACLVHVEGDMVKTKQVTTRAHPPTKLTPTQAQAHPGTCLSKALSQAHPPAKLTKTPSFAHLGTCLTKVQSRAHLASRVIKVQSKAHLSTELTKAQSQAQLVTETAKCLYTAQHSAELSGKTQSQPLLAGFKVSTQPCKRTGALGNLPQAKPEDRLTQIQPHSYVQGKGTQGPSQGPCETKSTLVPLAASAGHPTCNIESWGDSGATRAQSPMPGPATPCPEELGPVDAGIAGGQAWNSAAVPSGAPWDTVGREAAVDPKQSGEQVASLQAVEKVVTRAVVTIQACARGYLVRRTIRVWHQWAVIIQAAWRGYRVRRDLARLSQAATTIQATWRGFRTRQIETQLQLLPGVWTKADGSTKSTSDHRCFQSCQPRVCPLCQSLSPSLGSPPSVVMLVGSSPRTCHMCGHTLPTRVVHGMGRGSRVQASAPWGCDSPMASRSSQQSHLQNKAATTIQAAWRGFAVRRQLRQQQMAARMLQSNWRGHHTRVGLTPDALLGAAAWDNPEDMQWPGV